MYNAMTLNELLSNLGVSDFDILLLGDGSGTGYDTPIGYCCTMIEKVSGVRTLFTGGSNKGTIGQAEILPYLLALRFDYFKTHQGKLKGKRKVVILSDSQVSVNIGMGINSIHTNQDIWASYNWFKNVGYEITWKWVGRNENEIHVLAHNMANIVRKICDSEKNIDLYQVLPTQGSFDKE